MRRVSLSFGENARVLLLEGERGAGHGWKVASVRARRAAPAVLGGRTTSPTARPSTAQDDLAELLGGRRTFARQISKQRSSLAEELLDIPDVDDDDDDVVDEEDW